MVHAPSRGRLAPGRPETEGGSAHSLTPIMGSVSGDLVQLVSPAAEKLQVSGRTKYVLRVFSTAPLTGVSRLAST